MNRVSRLCLTAIILAPTVTLSACATVTTTALPLPSAGPSEQAPAEGVVYFLPRQLASVQVTRGTKTLAELAKKVADAETNRASAITEQANASTALAQAQAAVVAGSPTQAGRNLLNTQLAAAQGRMGIAVATVATRQTQYDAAVLALRNGAIDPTTFAPGAVTSEVKISLLDPTPDPDFAFVLSPRHSILRDDESNIVVNANGMLTSTNITAVDRTGDVLVEMATLAGGLLGFANARSDTTSTCDGSATTFTAAIDFTDSSEVSRLNHQLRCYGVHLKVSSGHWGDVSLPGTPAPGASPQPYSDDGIIYRAPVEVQVEVQRCIDTVDQCEPVATPDTSWSTTQIIALRLPQAGPLSLVRQDAGALTRRNYTLAFDNGILTSYQSSRPGEALEVARLPMRLVSGVFDGLSRVVSLQTGRARDRLGLVNALAELDRAGITNETQRNTLLLNLLTSQGNLANGELVNETQRNTALLNLLTSQGNLANGELANEAQSNTALLNLLNSQVLLSNRAITSDTERLLALLNQLQAQGNLANGAITSETQRYQALLGLLGAQNQLAVQSIGTPVQLASAQLQADLQLAATRARQSQLESCLLAQYSAGTPDQIDICLVTP